MKKLIFLLFGFCFTALAQIQPIQSEKNAGAFLQTSNGTAINGKSYTGSTGDTTEILNLFNHKTLYVTVQSQDSTTILVAYSYSNDGANFTAYVTKDSLSHSADGVGVKSIDFTSILLGASYARFRFTHSALAFAVGTTSPTYNATYLFKKE